MAEPWGIPLRKVDMKFNENWVPGFKVDLVDGEGASVASTPGRGVQG
jgi:hypothetical protein